MKRVLYATVALALLGAPAANAGDQALGAAGGAAAGAATGAVVGGPVGAAVGGVAGAIIGSAAAVPRPARTYVVEHPVESVQIRGRLSRGYTIPESVEIHQIPDEPAYGYVYVNDRPVIVKERTREVVYAEAAGSAPAGETTGAIEVRRPPRTVITYVERHQMQPVTVQGRIEVGSALPQDIELTPVPDDPEYAYVYTDDGPVVVQRHSRRVIWVR